MIIETYNPEYHIDQLKEWFIQWEIHHSAFETLPTTGLIIDGICAIFMYETNSELCLIEHFISNRNCKAEARLKGLDLISDAMISFAKSKGYKKMCLTTRHEKVIERCLIRGFKLSKHKYYSLNRSI